MKITYLKQTAKPYGRTVSELHIDIEVEESAPSEIIVSRKVGDKRHVYTYRAHEDGIITSTLRGICGKCKIAFNIN